MSPQRRMLTFLGTVTAIWTGLHVYVGFRVLDGLNWGGPARALVWVAVLLVAWAPFGAFFAGRSERGPTGPILEWAGFTAMGLSS
ncbi:MAG: metallophosphoesterase, partial [Gemmatimonadales bacterium]